MISNNQKIKRQYANARVLTCLCSTETIRPIIQL